MEQAAQSLATGISNKYSIKIVTHRASGNKSLYGDFTSLKRQKRTDTDGNRIDLLDPSIYGRLLLIPLFLWSMPGLPKSGKLFDYLYHFYRAAFRKRLEKLLGECNIVHCFSTGFLARCVSEICEQKKITLVHSPFIHFCRWGDSPRQLKAYSQGKAIICPTKSFKKQLSSFYPAGTHALIQVIPPITPEHDISDPENPPVSGRYILFLGRREEHKGLSILIDVFRKMETTVKLVIAGPGEQVETDDDRIVDFGEVDANTKCSLLNSCDLLCVPSKDETFGIVYTEAMSYGKPVVALDIPPVNEIVENSISGYLVPPGDTEALRTALEKLLSDELKRRNIGRGALDRYQNYFSRSKIIKEYLRLYEGLESQKQPDNSSTLQT